MCGVGGEGKPGNLPLPYPGSFPFMSEIARYEVQCCVASDHRCSSELACVQVKLRIHCTSIFLIPENHIYVQKSSKNSAVGHGTQAGNFRFRPVITKYPYSAAL